MKNCALLCFLFFSVACGTTPLPRGVVPLSFEEECDMNPLSLYIDVDKYPDLYEKIRHSPADSEREVMRSFAEFLKLAKESGFVPTSPDDRQCIWRKITMNGEPFVGRGRLYEMEPGADDYVLEGCSPADRRELLRRIGADIDVLDFLGRRDAVERLRIFSRRLEELFQEWGRLALCDNNISEKEK
ncbi:MAG TPA: hypothetical protein P5077_02155 [bacterium]|nr:hypothetical protein [bacterium]